MHGPALDTLPPHSDPLAPSPILGLPQSRAVATDGNMGEEGLQIYLPECGTQLRSVAGWSLTKHPAPSSPQDNQRLLCYGALDATGFWNISGLIACCICCHCALLSALELGVSQT